MWILYALLAAILWGLNYSLAEKILHSISPITLLSIEMFFGAILFFIISYFTHFKTDFHTLLTQTNILILTLVEVAVILLASYFIVKSINSKDATVAGIIEIIYPLFTVLFTWLLFGENHINLPVIIGGSLILVGVAIISFA
ncbi:MAG: DMT family transporter [Gammaproteobacteria bacterium]|nr:DMT family transporter [Gammaproteobacteria bacterium]